MNPKTSTKPWIAQDERTLVRYADLAHLIAQAKYLQAEDAAAHERERLAQETVLRQAARDGLLRVRLAEGLARRLNSPTDQELAAAVLLPREDLKPYLDSHGIELRLTTNGVWQRPSTLKEVAAFIREEQGWSEAQMANFLRRLEQAVRDGELRTAEPRTVRSTDGQQARELASTMNQPTRTIHEQVVPIDVNRWLARQGEAFRWNSELLQMPSTLSSALETSGADDSIKPLSRFLAQEMKILQVIRDAGYDPKTLPRQPGKPGVKAEVRTKLQKDKLFTGGQVFDKAWERLRGRGDIADVEGPN